jgi:peptide subunit release factor 1 (eRF1)
MAPTSETSRLLARLTRLRPGPHRIVTCYLKLEPRDRSRGKYLIKLKNRIRRVEASPAVTDLPREEREAVSKDLERIWSYLQVTSQLPRTQGIAIFACGGLRLFEAVALPTVHRSRLAVDRTALVRELASDRRAGPHRGPGLRGHRL